MSYSYENLIKGTINMQLEERQGPRGNFKFLKGVNRQIIVQCYIEGVETKAGLFETVNSTPSTDKMRDCLYAWKIKIANNIRREAQGQGRTEEAAISLSFYFNSIFRKRFFDTDNFTKPIIDAIAFGLSDKDIPNPDSRPKIRFGANDSRFKWVYFEREDKNMGLKGKEAIQITVCINKE